MADFTRVLAGPLATMTLADLGADVIKVERPGSGDETRSWGPPWSAHGSTYFECVNRSKRSIALDLRDPTDRAAAFSLVKDADVVIENFAPRTMERLGLGYDVIAAANPRVVYCSISGFGTAAPDGLLGYDFVVQAVGGLMSITGGSEPMKVGVALVDVLTGKDAVIGILAALEGRRRTGRGDRIEVSLLSSLLAGLVNQGQAALETACPGQRLANRHPSIAPYETLRCSDGVVAVACGNDSQFTRLAEVLGIPELARDPRFTVNADRVAHREVLVELLEERLAGGSAAAWVERLTKARVPAGRVNSIPEALDYADQLGLDPLVEVGPDHTRQVRSPIRWTAYRTRPPTPPPALGADKEAAW
ncbi:CaiB/BaiF CoA transferase family protein [Kribbella sp. GL6]|uniref:CaiB/BaiF CoA transferase family protein n=1 Tax=Kribbella sp. GL6 TaxID=3419765 RepID=UPI003D084B44